MHIYFNSFHSKYIPSNLYLITFNDSNTKLHHNSMFIFLKRNTNDSAFHLRDTSNRISEFRKQVLRRISIKRRNLISHTTAQKTPKEAPRSSFTKIRDPLDEGPSPLCLTHASKETRWTLARQVRQRCPTRMEPPRHKPVMTSYHRSLF